MTIELDHHAGASHTSDQSVLDAEGVDNEWDRRSVVDRDLRIGVLPHHPATSAVTGLTQSKGHEVVTPWAVQDFHVRVSTSSRKVA